MRYEIKIVFGVQPNGSCKFTSIAWCQMAENNYQAFLSTLMFSENFMISD